MYSEHFKSWLSGFIDGEGCFSFRRNASSNRYFIIEFDLALRADELETIKYIQKYFGCGTFSFFQPKDSNGKLQVRYRISGSKNCKKVIEHINKYPLLAKKKNDYEIWREATLLLLNKEHLKGRRDYLFYLAEKIKNIREYNRIEIENFDDKQLKLEVI